METVSATGKHVTELASKDAEPPLISVYLPIASLPDDTRKNDIRLKNAIAAAESKLKSVGTGKKSSRRLLEPLRAWRSRGGLQPDSGRGAAAFIDGKDARLFIFPEEVPELTVVSDRFYLRPAICALSAQASYRVLALALNSVELYQGHGRKLKPIELSEEVPRSVSDALGRELTEPQLQHHAGSAGSKNAIFHGHGAGKDDKDSEVTRFLKKLDEALRRTCLDDTPLVLAGVDDLTAEYRKISDYEPILPTTVKGSPDSFKDAELAEEAWQAYQTDTEQRRVGELERLVSGDSDRPATADLEEIIAAAQDGRIERLFIASDRTSWGRFDRETRQLKLLDADAAGAVDLLDLAASHSIATGAEVVALPAEAFPSEQQLAAAVLRYTTADDEAAR